MLGSSRGTVGRVVTSDTSELQLVYSHRQFLLIFIVCQRNWKDENKEKEAGKCGLSLYFTIRRNTLFTTCFLK